MKTLRMTWSLAVAIPCLAQALPTTILGHTTAGLDQGKPLAADSLQQVNSPLEVRINGIDSRVINKIGWPGTTGVYRVDFRVPNATVSGAARMQLSAAWIAGPEAQFPVR